MTAKRPICHVCDTPDLKTYYTKLEVEGVMIYKHSSVCPDCHHMIKGHIIEKNKQRKLKEQKGIQCQLQF